MHNRRARFHPRLWQPPGGIHRLCKISLPQSSQSHTRLFLEIPRRFQPLIRESGIEGGEVALAGGFAFPFSAITTVKQSVDAAGLVSFFSFANLPAARALRSLGSTIHADCIYVEFKPFVSVKNH